jgi:hypothetical protein
MLEEMVRFRDGASAPRATLPGPSRTITVEPITAPAREEPAREPEREPEPVPEPEREREPEPQRAHR